jgi:hypothetical protein
VSARSRGTYIAGSTVTEIKQPKSIDHDQIHLIGLNANGSGVLFLKKNKKQKTKIK